MTETKWQRSDECVFQPLEDSVVILDIQSGFYFALNETSTVVWDTIAEPATTSQIVAALQARYVVDEARCRVAVTRILDELGSKGLLASCE